MLLEMPLNLYIIYFDAGKLASQFYALVIEFIKIAPRFNLLSK